MNIFEDNFNIHAGAVSCIRRKSTLNPIAGTLMYNAFHANPSINTLDETISTTIHEVFHTLFFDRSLYKHYPPNSEGLSAVYEDDQGTFQIRSDNVVAFAQKHFNCKQS